MEKKLNYNREIIEELKDKIDDAEDKVHAIQRQAYVIKNNAQYKKVADVDEMIDACSYKLWSKEQLEEVEIASYQANLKSMADILENKA